MRKPLTAGKRRKTIISLILIAFSISALGVPGEWALNQETPGVVGEPIDKIQWSPDDSYISFKTSNKVYIYDWNNRS